jgi:hypothetical protein
MTCFTVRTSSAATVDVIRERERQRAIGYTAAHDDAHAAGQLALATAARAYGSTRAGVDLGHDLILEALDPWPGKWRNADRRQLLVEAGALILAEIERLDRLAAPIREALDPDNRG